MQNNQKAKYLQHIELWKVQGGSVRTYCANNGLVPSVFYYYKKMLEPTEKKGFTTVSVTAKSSCSLFSFHYPNGVIVEVDQGVDMATLKSLVHAVS